MSTIKNKPIITNVNKECLKVVTNYMDTLEEYIKNVSDRLSGFNDTEDVSVLTLLDISNHDNGNRDYTINASIRYYFTNGKIGVNIKYEYYNDNVLVFKNSTHLKTTPTRLRCDLSDITLDGYMIGGIYKYLSKKLNVALIEKLHS